MRYKIFDLYEDIEDNDGLSFRLVAESDYFFVIALKLLKAILIRRKYNDSYGWRLDYSGSLTDETIKKRTWVRVCRGYGGGWGDRIRFYLWLR